MTMLTEVEAIELLVVENKRLRAEKEALKQELVEAQWALAHYRRVGW